MIKVYHGSDVEVREVDLVTLRCLKTLDLAFM